MAENSYLDFDLEIEQNGETYRARVASSPAGEASSDFALPLSALEVENFQLRITRPRGGVRGVDTQEMAQLKDFGGRLFNAALGGQIQSLFLRSIEEARIHKKAGVRLRLRLNSCPEIAGLPWEYLYNANQGQFLALSSQTPIVRYMELGAPARPLKVSVPVRILVMIASPHDYPALDVNREWDKLRKALGDLESRGLVALERIDQATLPTLQHRVREGEFHIFHFVGHGGFDEQRQEGILLFEGDEGRGHPVSAQELAVVLHDEGSLQLAVLNACEGARTSKDDVFAGTAQELVRQLVPAVIAMQAEITDDAAIAFTEEFYAALADGYAVDAALGEGRKAIFAQGNELEWGTPVLYMRSPDGRLFDVAPHQPARTATSQPTLRPAAMAEPVPATPVPAPFGHGVRESDAAPTGSPLPVGAGPGAVAAVPPLPLLRPAVSDRADAAGPVPTEAAERIARAGFGTQAWPP